MALGARRHGLLRAPLLAATDREAEVRPTPEMVIGVRCTVEGQLDPGEVLVPDTRAVPEDRQGRGEPEQVHPGTRPLVVLHRCPEVGALGPEAPDQGRRRRARHPRAGLLCQSEVVARMPVRERARPSRSAVQELERVVADGLEQAEPATLPHHEAGTDQSVHVLTFDAHGDGRRRPGTRLRTPRGGRMLAPASADRRSTLHAMVARSACWRPDRSRGPSEARSSRSPRCVRHLVERHLADPCRRQLDGEREPVETRADPFDRLRRGCRRSDGRPRSPVR